MSGLEELRARLAECEALLMRAPLTGSVSVDVLRTRATALRDAIAIVEPDYAAGAEAQEEAEEEELVWSREPDEAEATEAEAGEEADLQDAAAENAEAGAPAPEGVRSNAAAVRAWCREHRITVSSMGPIPSHQLRKVNERRVELGEPPFLLVGGR